MHNILLTNGKGSHKTIISPPAGILPLGFPDCDKVHNPFSNKAGDILPGTAYLGRGAGND